MLDVSARLLKSGSVWVNDFEHQDARIFKSPFNERNRTTPAAIEEIRLRNCALRLEDGILADVIGLPKSIAQTQHVRIEKHHVTAFHAGHDDCGIGLYGLFSHVR